MNNKVKDQLKMAGCFSSIAALGLGSILISGAVSAGGVYAWNRNNSTEIFPAMGYQDTESNSIEAPQPTSLEAVINEETAAPTPQPTLKSILEPIPEPTPQPEYEAPVPEPVAVPVAKPVKVYSSQPEIEKLILRYVKVERSNAGLPIVEEDSGLAKIAKDNSTYRANRDIDSFSSGNGKNMGRIAGYGDQSKIVAKKFMGDWMEDPEQKANILDPKWSRAGVSVLIDGNEHYATLYFSAK